MIKRVGIWLGFCLLFCSGVFAQSDAGKIKGTVKDESGEPVEFATVVIISNGIIKGGANTNAQGEFSIAPVEPGLYEVRASFAGNTINASGINVAANKTVDVPLAIETGVELKEVQITETIPIDNTTTGGSISGQMLKISVYETSTRLLPLCQVSIKPMMAMDLACVVVVVVRRSILSTVSRYVVL